MTQRSIKIIAISDTHNRHDSLTIPECDILLHAGDYSFKGDDSEIKNFYKWLNKQPAKHKVSIQGNHEIGWEKDPENGKRLALENCPDVHLLENELVTIEGINIYGTPWTPWFCDWAYNAGRSEAEATMHRVPTMKEILKDMPDNINILMSHGPVYGILDELHSVCGDPSGIFVGCEDLKKKVDEIKPDIHICGHIHCNGVEQVHKNGTSYYNVSVCDEMYYPSNGITEIIYE